MSTKQELFYAAFNKVKNPETWAQHYYSYDDKDKQCAPIDPSACKWCSMGAIYAFIKPYDENFAHDLLLAFMEELHDRGVDYNLACFNDTQDHATVVALWERIGKKAGFIGA